MKIVAYFALAIGATPCLVAINRINVRGGVFAWGVFLKSTSATIEKAKPILIERRPHFPSFCIALLVDFVVSFVVFKQMLLVFCLPISGVCQSFLAIGRIVLAGLLGLVLFVGISVLLRAWYAQKREAGSGVAIFVKVRSSFGLPLIALPAKNKLVRVLCRFAGAGASFAVCARLCCSTHSAFAPQSNFKAIEWLKVLRCGRLGLTALNAAQIAIAVNATRWLLSASAAFANAPESVFILLIAVKIISGCRQIGTALVALPKGYFLGICDMITHAKFSSIEFGRAGDVEASPGFCIGFTSPIIPQTGGCIQ